MRRRTITVVVAAAFLAAGGGTASARIALRSTVHTHTGTHRLALGLACTPRNFRCKGLLDPFRFARVSSRVPRLRVRLGERVRFRLPLRPSSASITAYARGNRMVGRLPLRRVRSFAWRAMWRRELRHGGVIAVITLVTKDAHRYGYAARFVKG